MESTNQIRPGRVLDFRVPGRVVTTTPALLEGQKLLEKIESSSCGYHKRVIVTPATYILHGQAT